MRRRLFVVAGVLVLLALAAAGAYYLYVRHASRDIRGSSTVEFTTTQAAPHPKEPGVIWPTYGFDPARQRVAVGMTLAPPYRNVWTFHAGSLVEFPPVIGYGRLFFASNGGTLYAVGAKNGKRAWSYVSHRCVAASPALDRHTVYMTFLNPPPCNRPPSSSLTGLVAAFTAGNGRFVWQKTIGPSESSPLVARGNVYVGDWDGRIWALRQRTGKVSWVTKLGGEVKGGVALAGNRLYIGDYSGHVYALNATTGKVLWTASAQPRLGSTGTFYATPAVAYDRVYVGATDGKMYSFGAASGELRWSSSTGGYVYSSAAVWRDRVLVGSYSHQFYCFDAATGSTRWQFTADGPISGSPTVIAGRVYFATLNGTTYALDAKTGRKVWTYPDGKYSPVVADGEQLYLVGYARVYALVERR
jgi:outer membrane protein assembly factor BamB